MKTLRLGYFALRIGVVLSFTACFQTLPPSVRLASGDKTALETEAKAYIAGLGYRFRQFFPTTGYPDYGAVEARVAASKELLGAEFVDMVIKERVNVGRYAEEENRLSIAEKGFLSIHETNTSSFNIDQKGRNAVEASCLGISFGDYARIPPGLKPKYGLLLPPSDSALLPPEVRKWYGPDLYIFRLKDVKERLTWTPGDSLDRLDKWASARGVDWKSGEVLYPAGWDLFFIPWRYRALMIPLMARDVRASGRLGFSSTPEDPLYNLPEGEKLRTVFQGPNAVYLEIQIWGPIDLDNVERFIFTTTPPEGDFLTELKKRAIPVYDGRKGKPVRWSGIFIRPGFRGQDRALRFAGLFVAVPAAA